jgi:hypothetical protein
VDRRTRRELVERLNRDAGALAGEFGLRFRAIEADRANAVSRYGICYSDGTIRIRLRHATTGRPLKYSSLVNTLCHELAHLKHFDHGPRFKAFYLRILAVARTRGIYRPGRRGAAPVVRSPEATRTPEPTPPRRRPRDVPPGPPVPSGPIQLDLFGLGR